MVTSGRHACSKLPVTREGVTMRQLGVREAYVASLAKVLPLRPVDQFIEQLDDKLFDRQVRI